MRVILIAFVFATTVTNATAQPSTQEKEWVAFCVSQISVTNKSRAQAYCTCMAESVDTSAKMRQTDLERSFPPVHRLCFDKAGFRAPN